ncbi:hypothetical protein GE061_019596 [Apolygus lucorum]|uniref:Uncharacterized protein n=1 Tax=Apolygus lucorum TaxID=248454 RepID=A0A6A4JZZ1_APOLU|nr:hypothetical protein GE061_019596 [Apolygus lucorum]
MAEDMLMCFDSPLNPPKANPRILGMKSPLIPCPRLPFDIVAETAAMDADPFERVLKTALSQTPGRGRAMSLPCSPTSPRRTRELPQDSVLDLSAALSARCLVSSTPNPGMNRYKHPQSPKLVNSAPGTPTSHQRSARLSPLSDIPRRSVISDKDIEMSSEQLRMTVMKKLETLQVLNQNLPSSGRSHLRRSISSPNLPKGERQQTFSGALESSNATRDYGVIDFTYNKRNVSIINESCTSQVDCSIKGESFIKTNTLKKEALKLSSLFQNITVDLDDSDDCLATPIKEKTKWRHSRTFAGNDPGSPEDLRQELPPWEWSGSSSEDEDGLPKIKRLRVSVRSEAAQSPDTITLLTRYKKKRDSFKFEDDKESEVITSSQSQPVVQEAVPAPVPTTQDIAIVPQIVIPPAPESDLRPKSATTNVVKKGPLKAVLPLPTMVKSVIPPSAQVTTSKANNTSGSQSSIQGPRRKGMLAPFRRTNSSSALRSQPNPVSPSPKQKSTNSKVVEKPSTAPSKGVSENLSSKSEATKKGPSLLKKRSSSAPGKENLIKK